MFWSSGIYTYFGRVSWLFIGLDPGIHWRCTTPSLGKRVLQEIADLNLYVFTIVVGPTVNQSINNNVPVGVLCYFLTFYH